MQLPFLLNFPLGVTSGPYAEFFDTSLSSTWNPAFLSDYASTSEAELALDSFLTNGTVYINIHTTEFSDGKIRGFFSPASSPVPEPTTMLLFSVGLSGLLNSKVKRKKMYKEQ